MFQFLKKVEEENIPAWLYRSEPDTEKLNELPENERFKGEESAKQVYDRLAGTGLIGVERKLFFN